jgi:hypothetical protein
MSLPQVLRTCGYLSAMQYDCDLLLRQNGDEKRMPHRFLAEIEPGRFLRLEGHDWIVTEITKATSRSLSVVRLARALSGKKETASRRG